MRILIPATILTMLVSAVLIWNTDRTLTDPRNTGIRPIETIHTYVDLDYGFSMAVPAGWRKIVLAEQETPGQTPELGYAVGFEALPQSTDDNFADYILLEILPGTDSGLFAAGDADSQSTQIDGQTVTFDRLFIDGQHNPDSGIDLVIFQREYSALGYTIDFYAIGEPDNEKVLFEAFQIMLVTFEQFHPPFMLS
jgi:hypothetical protein